MFGVVNKPQFSERDLVIGRSYDLIINTYNDSYTGYGSGEPYTVSAILVHVEPFKLCFAVMKPLTQREDIDLQEMQYSDEPVSVAAFMDLKTVSIDAILDRDIEISEVNK